jgi:cytosine/adenosine deaminase-related metal-dependent hydrolase
VNDPYYPFGKPDPLEWRSMMAHVAQLTLPHELEQAMSMVTENAAKAARVDDYGIAPRQACRPGGRRRPLGS